MNIDDRLVDELYDIIGNGGFTRLPSLVSEATGARSCTFQLLGADDVPQVVTTSYFTEDMNRHYVAEAIFEHDIWAQVASPRLGNGSAVDMTGYVPDDVYRSSRFYQDMIRLFGDDTGRCIGLMLPVSQGRKICIGVHRPFAGEPFQPHQVETLNHLRQHLVRITDAQARFDAVEIGRGNWEAAFLAMPQPVMVVAAGGMLMLLNGAAEDVVRREDGLAVAGGRIEISRRAERDQLAACLARVLARQGARGGAVLVTRADGRRPYRLVLLPLELRDRTHALVLIDDPDRARLERPDYLRALYGLTRAEADVAMLVAAGETIETVADIRSVSTSTAKTLLQRTYQKTEVAKAAQLARLIAELPD